MQRQKKTNNDEPVFIQGSGTRMSIKDIATHTITMALSFSKPRVFPNSFFSQQPLVTI